MTKVKEVAKYLIFAYERQTSSQFENSELKLQKLMYLIQRESLCLTGEVMFDTKFEGWKQGPVIPELRFYFENDYEVLNSIEDSNLSSQEMYIINNVIAQYGMYESWYLANLTHEESSWLNSRRGLNKNEHGCNYLSVDDIKNDAKKIRQYDYIFDMYLDEFEDVEEDNYV
ncbi:MAG: DUF4065 domain-containing protein [Bacillota bacterium]|nr:DUF4065 domain-containing protein [Bacillota bacterium]